MKSGSSQNSHLNQHLAEKQEEKVQVQKGIQFFGYSTSTMSSDKKLEFLGGLTCTWTLYLMVWLEIECLAHIFAKDL